MALESSRVRTRRGGQGSGSPRVKGCACALLHSSPVEVSGALRGTGADYGQSCSPVRRRLRWSGLLWLLWLRRLWLRRVVVDIFVGRVVVCKEGGSFSGGVHGVVFAGSGGWRWWRA